MLNDAKTQAKMWAEKQRLENPLANHQLLSKCLFAYLASVHAESTATSSSYSQTEPLTKSASKHHRRRKRHRRSKVKRRTQKNLAQTIESRFSKLENLVKDQLEKVNAKLVTIEEKYDKESMEQHGMMEYVQKELYSLKNGATNYFLRNNNNTLAEHSMALREDIGRATGQISSISEKSEEESESDPLEELLNRKNDNKGFGINLRENQKQKNKEEDPIMALLLQTNEKKEAVKAEKPDDEKENLGKKAKTEVEIPKPRNMMFRMNKGKSTNSPQPSMDDLLFGN